MYSENDWTDVTKVGTYEKSKTLAEKAAWDLVNSMPGDTGVIFLKTVTIEHDFFVYFCVLTTSGVSLLYLEVFVFQRRRSLSWL